MGMPSTLPDAAEVGPACGRDLLLRSDPTSGTENEDDHDANLDTTRILRYHSVIKSKKS